LKVRQTESINELIQSKGLTQYASITPSFASNISQKLDAGVFIFGSIKQAGSTIRLNAQLIDSKTQEIFKSFEIDGPAREEKIFLITDSLKRMLKNFLLISKLTKELTTEFQQVAFTISPEAYKYFIYGENARRKSDHATAMKMYSQAMAIDSNFIFATTMLSVELYNQSLFDSGRKLCLKVYRKRDLMTMQQKIWVNRLHAMYFETPTEEIQYLRQLLEIDDQMPFTYYAIGYAYNKLCQYDKAIPEFEKSLSIYEKRETKPYWLSNYLLLGIAYTKTHQYDKAKQIYLKAAHDFPNFKSLNYSMAILSLSSGKTRDANEYIEKILTTLKQNSISEAEIASSLGYLYMEADNMEKAEEYYRQALSLEPENPFRLNDLACLLIYNDRNVIEGMKLIEEAYKMNLDLYYYGDCKGWGLYKQGKYNDALRFLEKSDSLKPVYDHTLYLHLEAAKKAFANQKL
jgi:tetratricopeptide (TPR) repeat protein